MANESGPRSGTAERDPAGAATVVAASAGAGLLVAQQVAAKVARDAFFLSEFPVSRLPFATAAGAVLSLSAVVLLARGMARLPPARLLPRLLWSSAILLVGEWALSLAAPRWAAAAVYLHVAMFGPTAISTFWALVNERFDPHSARRVMGRIGTGASVGGVLGAALTWRASKLVAITTLLLGVAALLVLAAVAVQRLVRTGAGPGGRPEPERGRSQDDAPPRERGGSVIASMPYLRSLALLIALCALMESLLDYTFSATAVTRFGRGEALVGFFAAFHTVTGVVSLVVQALLVRWSLARLGLAGTLTLHPGAIALLAGVTAATPAMPLVLALRAAEAVLRHSTFRSAYELFYTPLPPQRKRPAKPLIDVGADRLGTLLGSGATAAALAAMGVHAVRMLLLLACATAVSMVIIAFRLHRGYISALGDSLRAGVVRLEQDEVLDSTTRRTLEVVVPAPVADAPSRPPVADVVSPEPAVEDDLRSGEPGRIRRALAEADLDPALVALVTPLLGRDDLFGDVILALRRAAPRCTGQLIDVLLDDSAAPVVRRRVPRVLASVPTQRAADGLVAGLSCERLDVRYRSAQALVRLRQRATVSLPSATLFALAAREIEGLDRGGGARLEHVFAVLSLAMDGEPVTIAFRALRDGDLALRGTALEYLDHVLPASIRTPLWPRLGAPEGATVSRRSLDDVRGELLRSSWRMSAMERRIRGSAAL